MIDNATDIDVAQKTFIENAEKIGERITSQTFWDEEGRECNWMGRAELENAPSTVASGALVASLYAGSGGVALFLVELYAQTKERNLLRIATAALRRSFNYVRLVERPRTSALSFWAGHLGVAYAAFRLRQVTGGEDTLDGEINWALDRAEEAMLKKHPLDLMGGNAGAIAPLLSMATDPAFERCRDLALLCGREILEAAAWSNGTCSWDAVRTSGGDIATPPWSGFSHGASGLATALLNIFDINGDERYLATARAAFAYEDLLFSPAHNNWLDVRFPHALQNGIMNGSYQSAWCHGAPGIAMARLRAIHSDPDQRDRYESSGRIAITTTLAAIERAFSGPSTDTTLCHGISGLLEVLLTCALLLDDQFIRRTAQDYGLKLIDRYAAAGEWPSGITTAGPTPALMIGSSGVAHHFLRQAAPEDVSGLLLFGS